MARDAMPGGAHWFSSRPQWRSLLRLLAGAGLVLACTIMISRVDLRRTGDLVGSAQPMPLGTAFLLSLIFLGVKGYRWQLLTRGAGHTIPLLPASRISALGIFMSAMYPGLGEATRLLLLKRYALPASSAATIVVTERLVDTIALGLTLALAAPFSTAVPHVLGSRANSLLLALSVMVGAIGGVIVLTSTHRHWSARFPTIIARLEHLFTFVGACRASLMAMSRQPIVGLTIVATTLLAHLLAALAGWTVLLAFDSSISLVTATVLVAVVNVGLGLLPSPFGLGLYQAAGLLVLGSMTMDQEIAIAAASSLQIVTFGAATLTAVVSGAVELRLSHPRAIRSDTLGEDT